MEVAVFVHRSERFSWAGNIWQDPCQGQCNGCGFAVTRKLSRSMIINRSKLIYTPYPKKRSCLSIFPKTNVWSAKKVAEALYAIWKIHEFLVCTSLEKHPTCAKVDKCPQVHSWKVCGRYFVVNCNSWTRLTRDNSKWTERAAHNNFSVSGSFTHSTDVGHGKMQLRTSQNFENCEIDRSFTSKTVSIK